MQSKTKDRHRQVECGICNKVMRSDNLKRPKKVHKDLLSLPDNEIKDELKSRQEIKKKQEEKIQKVVEIARANNLAVPDEIIEKKHKLDKKNQSLTGRNCEKSFASRQSLCNHRKRMHPENTVNKQNNS